MESIVSRVLEAKAAKQQQWPVNSNRASDLGHPCLRYHVLNRTRWQERALPSPELLLVFALGNVLEEVVLQDVKEAGIQVVEQQRPFKWEKYNITGHLDAKLQIDGNLYPCEIKSMSPSSFSAVDSITDMTRSKYLYMRKYPAQLTLYLLMSNHERGLFILKNKSTGAMKEVWFDLDYDLGEELIQRAEAVNAHIAAGTLPDPIDWDDSISGQCPYQHICSPYRIVEEMQVVDDESLLEMITRWDTLKPLVKEYEQIDGALKAQLEGRDRILVGPYWVTGSWRETTRYSVPDDIKKQYAEKIRYWVRKVIKT